MVSIVVGALIIIAAVVWMALVYTAEGMRTTGGEFRNIVGPGCLPAAIGLVLGALLIASHWWGW